jgi:hypothetical protein
VVLVIAPEVLAEKDLTAGDLLRSPLCGMWEDRVDISDNIAFARSLRGGRNNVLFAISCEAFPEHTVSKTTVLSPVLRGL